MFTYYTITKNNNIKITNTPVSVDIPTSIDVPIGGCSKPITVDIKNSPFNDVGVSFNYNNSKYREEIFWPNHHTTKSEMLFDTENTINTLSFCTADSYDIAELGNSFVVELVFIGTNFRSYEFDPSASVTINIISALSLPTPSLDIEIINIQKTFLDFNLSINSPGTIFYQLQIGQDMEAMDSVDIQVHLKNHEYILEEMD